MGINVLSDDYVLPGKTPEKRNTVNVLSDDYVLPKKAEAPAEPIPAPVETKKYAPTHYEDKGKFWARLPEEERAKMPLIPPVGDIITGKALKSLGVKTPVGLEQMVGTALPVMMEDTKNLIKSAAKTGREKGVASLEQVAFDPSRAAANIFGVGGSKALENVLNIPRNLPATAGHLGLVDPTSAEYWDKKLSKFDFANYVKGGMGAEQQGDEPLQNLIPVGMQLLPAVKPAVAIGKSGIGLAGSAAKKLAGKAPEVMTLEQKMASEAIKAQKAKLRQQQDVVESSKDAFIEQQRASQEAVGGSNPELMKYGLKGKKSVIATQDDKINDLIERLDKMKPISPMDEHVATSEASLNQAEQTVNEAKDLHKQALEAEDTAQAEHEAAKQGKKELEGEHAGLAREHQGLEDTHEQAKAEHEQAKVQNEQVSEQTADFFGKGRDFAKRGGEVLKKSLQEILDFWPKHYKNFINDIQKKNVKLPEHSLSELQDNIKNKKEYARRAKDINALKKQSDAIRKDLHKTLGKEADELQSEIDHEVADTEVADTTGNPYLDRLLKALPSPGKYEAFDAIGKFQDFKAVRYKMQQAMKRGESFANRELMADAIEQTGDIMPLIDKSLEKGLSPKHYSTWKWLNNGYTNEYFPVKNHPTARSIIKKGKLPTNTIDIINTDEPTHKIMQDIIKSTPELNKDVLGQHHASAPEDIFNPTDKTKPYVDALPELHPHIANKVEATKNIQQKASAEQEAEQRVNESRKAQRSAKNRIEDYGQTIDAKEAAVKQAKKHTEIVKRHVAEVTEQHKKMAAQHKKLVEKSNKIQKQIDAQDKARVQTRNKLKEAQQIKASAEKEIIPVEAEIKKLIEMRKTHEMNLKEKTAHERKLQELRDRRRELNDSIVKSTGILRIGLKIGLMQAKKYAKKAINLP